jgi:virginiamycin B lyase
MQLHYSLPLTALLASLFGMPVTAVAQQQSGIIEYVLPSLYQPHGSSAGSEIAAGPDGAVWFPAESLDAGTGTHVLVRLTTSGAITQFPVPVGTPSSITTGPDGALWFQLSPVPGPNGSGIGRMTTSGVFSVYPLTAWFGDGEPIGGITSGPGGNLWFTGGGLGYITTSGQMVARSSKDIPGGGAMQGPIVAGSGGNNLWVVSNGLARCTTAFVCKDYLTIGGASSLAAGPDGAIWFGGGVCSTTGCSVGRIDPSGVITTYPVPAFPGIPDLSPFAIGNDGALWFGAQGRIFRMTSAGVVTEYPLPNPNAWLTGMAAGTDGMWFTESELYAFSPFDNIYVDRIGLIAPLSASLTSDSSAFKPGDTITLTGSGFASGETVNLLYSSDLGQELPSSIAADSTGSFAITGQAGPTPFGDNSISATGQSSGKLGVATVMVNPRLALEPSSGSIGDTITANAGGLPASLITYFYWRNPWTSLGSTRIDPIGRVTGFTFTIPAGAVPGENTVIVSPYRLSANDGAPPPAPNGIVGAYVTVVASSPSQ